MILVEKMPKKKDESSPNPLPSKKSEKQTTVRAFISTAKKLRELAELRGVAVHDLLELLLAERLDDELIEETERRLAELKQKHK